MRLFDLKTDNRITPLGTDEAIPSFSFKVEGEGAFVNSYRIQVATAVELLNNDAPDMWDSGVIASNVTFGIVYAGKALESCTRYFWRVIAEGIKSEITWFETAFLDPENEFKAWWIGQPLGFAGSVDDIRFDFDIDKPVKSARFYVAALGTGRFYLNGELLDDCYFDGAVSVYHKEIYYRTYELNFRQGKNCLCARVGYGFYGAKKMYGIMRTVFEDGSISVTPTFPGRAWNVKRDPVRLNGVFDGELYDARTEEDWLNPEYKVTFGNWVATFAADMPMGKLRANPIPPMRIVSKFKPKTIEEFDGGLRVDTGVNLCGFLSFKFKGEKGAKVVITHSERLLASGYPDNANYRAAECMDTYILKGEGIEEFVPQFTYHGFQYAFIKTEGKVEILDITVNFLRTDVEVTGEFKCSDETLNTLHKIAVQTEGNNLNGVFTDCPQRDERLGWLNDLSSRMYQSVGNYGLECFLPNFIDMITLTQNEEGVFGDTVPFEVGSDKADPISAYTTLANLALDYYGDKKVLERNYEGFTKWVNYLKADADENNGVVEKCIYGDWCPALIFAPSKEKDTYSKFIPPQFTSAISFLWYLKQMSRFATVLGKGGDAKDYADKYVYYKAKFNEKYLDKKTNLYCEGAQTACAFAITVFSEDKDLCAYWAKVANDDVVARDYHMTCGNIGYRHLIYNLAEFGYADTVKKLLVNPEYPGWGFMLSRGATSVWERWEDSVGSDMHSFDHPMFTGYDGFFYRYILGIKVDKFTDNFAKLVVKPCFVNGIDFAEGSQQTPRGKIYVSWKKNGDVINVTVSTPANTSLTFIAENYKITCGNDSVDNTIELTNGKFDLVLSK